MQEETLGRQNLMDREGYAPYCMSEACTYSFDRMVFTGEQFECKRCSDMTEYPDDFMKRYKTKWHHPPLGEEE